MTSSEVNLKTIVYIDQQNNIPQSIQLRPIQNALQDQIQPPHPQQKRRGSEIIHQPEKIADKKQTSTSKMDVINANLNPESEIKVQKNITIQQILPVFYSIPNSNQIRQIKKQCQFCAQYLGQDNFEKAFTCIHLYCKNCLNTYSQIQFKNYKIILCPQVSCKAPIDEHANYFNSLSQKMKNKYQIIKFRKNISENQNLALCPDQKCTKGFMEIKAGDKNGQCKQCNVVYCLNCKIKSHSGKCQNFQEILLKNKFKYKRCFGCKSIVERKQGCPHMTCKCGSQFCYYCGSKWGSPHRCIRILAGGILITDRLNTNLKCLRHQDYEYEQNFLGNLMKIPYYIVTIILMVFYLSWCLLLLSLMITLVFVASSIAGYFAIQYKLLKIGTTISRVFFFLFIIFLPIGFLIGWLGSFGALIVGIFPKYLELALSGRLIPCMY